MFKGFFKQDFILTTCIILLSMLGIISIFSTNQSYTGVRQAIFVITGLILYFIIMSIDYKLYRQRLIQILAYSVIIILLILIYVLNIKSNNTYRWFTLGSIDVQPAEFAKIVVIIITAGFFTFFRKVKNPLKKIALVFLIVAPIILLIFKQPALGTSIVVFVIWLSIVFASYHDHMKFIYILITFILSALLVTSFFKYKYYKCKYKFTIYKCKHNNITRINILTFYNTQIVKKEDKLYDVYIYSYNWTYYW